MAEVGVGAEAAHEFVFGGAHVGRREDGDVGREQAARAFAGFEGVPEGGAAAFAFGVDGGEAVVPEAALLAVGGAVVVGEGRREGFERIAFEEVIER